MTVVVGRAVRGEAGPILYARLVSNVYQKRCLQGLALIGGARRTQAVTRGREIRRYGGEQ